MKTTFTLLLFFLYNLQCLAQFNEEHIITLDAQSARFVHAADIDGDNFIDVIVTSSSDETIAWYKNLDGLGTFSTKNVITENISEYRHVSTADIDGDGDLDILSTALFEDIVVWFENLDGLGTFSARKIIDNTLDLPKMAVPFDFDLDGDLDVICPSINDSKITWFENIDGLGSFTLAQTITNIATTPSSVFVTDLDGDGDVDIVTDSSSFNNQPAWHENISGFGNFGTEQVLLDSDLGTIWVIATDIDGDNIMDVLTVEFGGDTIAWYKNDGLGNFGVKNIITTNVDAPYQIVAGDIDNDGDQDIVSVSGADDKIAWYENDGDGNFGEQILIDLTAINPRSIDIADFDGDGDLDVVSASIFYDKVVWYENYTILGIHANGLEQCISIVPNPLQNTLSITTNNKFQINQIQVYDIWGKLLLETQNTQQINVSHLANGVFFVKVQTNKGTLVKKVVKQ